MRRFLSDPFPLACHVLQGASGGFSLLSRVLAERRPSVSIFPRLRGDCPPGREECPRLFTVMSAVAARLLGRLLARMIRCRRMKRRTKRMLMVAVALVWTAACALLLWSPSPSHPDLVGILALSLWVCPSETPVSVALRRLRL